MQFTLLKFWKMLIHFLFIFLFWNVCRASERFAAADIGLSPNVRHLPYLGGNIGFVEDVILDNE